MVVCHTQRPFIFTELCESEDPARGTGPKRESYLERSVEVARLGRKQRADAALYPACRYSRHCVALNLHSESGNN